MWPLLVNPGRMADRGSDGWFINWVINRQIKNITGCVRHPNECKDLIFQGNIFYPNKNVLAYSEMFTLSGMLAYFPVILSKNPGVASGFVMLVGQAMTMLAVYLIWSNVTKNTWGSAIAAIAFGLSQIRWEYQVHMQMWSMQYWLLSYWLISRRRYVLGAVLIGLQAWESVLPVYFALVILLLTSKLSKYLILSLLIMLPVISVYRNVARENNFSRSIRDAAHGSMSVDDLWGKFYSPGLFILLIVAAKQVRPKLFVAILMTGVIMALGPVLKWQGKTVKIFDKYPVPLPYAITYYVVPGMDAFRTPSRWIWLAGFGMSGIIAMGLTHTLRGVGLLGCLLVAIVGGTHLTKYIDLPKPEEFPVVYKWLKEQPGKVVLELPMGGDERESKRMYYSWLHNKYLINGFSGFSPKINNVVSDYIIVGNGDVFDSAGNKLFESGWDISGVVAK